MEPCIKSSNTSSANIKKCADSSLQFAYDSNGLIGYEKLHVNQNSMQEVVVSETISKRSIKDISPTLV